MILSEAQFVRSIFDLGSIPTKLDQRATVNYVWHATQAAIRADAEGTATQRVKGQCDDPEESAMDRGCPMWTNSLTDAALPI